MLDFFIFPDISSKLTDSPRITYYDFFWTCGYQSTYCIFAGVLHIARHFQQTARYRKNHIIWFFVNIKLSTNSLYIAGFLEISRNFQQANRYCQNHIVWFLVSMWLPHNSSHFSGFLDIVISKYRKNNIVWFLVNIKLQTNFSHIVGFLDTSRHFQQTTRYSHKHIA